MLKTYLLQNPYDEYAVHFIELIYQKYGLKPVCFYTEPKMRFFMEKYFPQLRGPNILAHHNVDVAQIPAFVRQLQKQYEILGVVPFIEANVEVAAAIAEQLELPWNAPGVLQRFRNKYALKQHLAAQQPGLRLPKICLARQAEDVLAWQRPERFVVKPNDGFGNRDVAIFGHDVGRETLTNYFGQSPGDTFVCEEYIGGIEYGVNGHVDSQGTPQVLIVLEFKRIFANGREGLTDIATQVHSHDPRFAVLAQYAAQVIRGLGLRRSPFQMDVKLDEHGPCMIDVGARLVGNGTAFLCNRLHGNTFDIFAWAARDYLFADAPPVPPVDYSEYDAHSGARLHGVAYKTELVSDVQGIAQVEALPQFAGWSVKPKVGEMIHQTRCLGTVPYLLDLAHRGSMDDLLQAAAVVREVLRWNQQRRLSQRLQARAKNLTARFANRLGWAFSGRVHA